MRYENLIRDALVRMRDEGKTRAQAAAELGMAYPTISAKIAALGIEWPNVKWRRAAFVERNRQVADLFDAGLALQEIGDEFGITRERVRQIVEKMGRTPRLVQFDNEMMNLAEKVAAAPDMSAPEMASELGVSYSHVRRAAQIAGKKLLKRDSETTAHLAALAERVKAGEAYHAVAASHSEASKLAAYCRENGIKSLAPSRWSVDPEMRKRVAFEMRSSGAAWAEIAREIAKNEGVRRIIPQAVTNWLRKHAPEVMDIKPQKRERAKRRVRAKCERAERSPKRPVVRIDIRKDIRETAIANYGKVPASAIAAQLGVSRNSIIGHWFRARQSGEIAA